MTEPILNGVNEQLNITPFLTQFTNFAKKHAYFRRQGFAEFVKVLSRRLVSYFSGILRKELTPLTLKGIRTCAVDCTVSNSSACRLSVSSRNARGRPKLYGIILLEVTHSLSRSQTTPVMSGSLVATPQ